MKNRNFSLALAVLLIAILSLATSLSAARDKYEKTPSDHEGPFYPVIRQPDEDNDLLHVTGRPDPARGDVLKLSGAVLNTRGQPQKGVTVEIWQTDPSGRYKDARDNTPGKRDPNFQYWGQATTAEDGTFFFKTLVPGGYAPRPAHIHFKVWQDGKVILTSQIYLRNQPGKSAADFFKKYGRDSQAMDLETTKKNEYNGYFQIVI